LAQGYQHCEEGEELAAEDHNEREMDVRGCGGTMAACSRGCARQMAGKKTETKG